MAAFSKKAVALFLLLLLAPSLFCQEGTQETVEEAVIAACREFIIISEAQPENVRAAATKLRDKIREYQANAAYYYQEVSGLDYLSPLAKIADTCTDLLSGRIDAAAARLAIELSVLDYYGSATDAYHVTAMLMFEVLIIITVLCVGLLAFALLFVHSKKKSILTESIIRSQEIERNRLSFELHDTVAQDVRAEQLFVAELGTFVPRNQETGPLLEKIALLEKKILSNIRSIIKDLASPRFEKLPFGTLLAEYCAEVANLHSISCPHSVVGDRYLDRLSREKKLHLFRMIQEAMTNAIKHGGAGEVSVLVRENYTERKIIVFVTDDGCGFDPKKEVHSDCFGLQGMRLRSSLIKAELTIDSELNAGTSVKIVVSAPPPMGETNARSARKIRSQKTSLF